MGNRNTADSFPDRLPERFMEGFPDPFPDRLKTTHASSAFGAASSYKQSAPCADRSSARKATFAYGAALLTDPEPQDSVRAAKVAEVRAALAAGTYHVSAQAVAGKLLDAMLAGRRSADS